MTVYTYTGSSIDAHVPRDTNTGATTYTAQTWKVGVAAPILLSSFVTDIRSAGDYELRIDGVAVASVAGVAAAATNVTFTPAAPVELVPGEYTLALVCTSGAVTWYARGNLGTTSLPAGVGGAGWQCLGWDYWVEPGSGLAVPGQLNFQLADEALQSGIAYDSLSSGSFTGQTWAVTFDQEVWLFGVVKRLFANDTWTLNIDGNAEATAVKAAGGSTCWDYAFVPLGGPLPLAAGARTFNLDPTANRRMVYDNGTTSVPSGSGSSHTTAWGNWTEASTNKVSAQLWFMLPTPPDAPENLAADPGLASIDFTWDPPSGGPTPTGYKVRLDAGAWVDVGLVLAHTFTPLAPSTTYTLEVRAYNSAGDGPAAASIEATTDAPSTPAGWYRLEVTVGGELLWDVARGECAGDEDGPAFGVVLPFTFGWRTPDKDPLPVQPDNTMMTFRVLAPAADDASVAGLVPGATIQVEMRVNEVDVDPWQTFTGQIVTATGEFIPWGDGVAWLVTVQAADGNAGLGGIVVGFGAVDDPWPLETVEDRLSRLQDEMDMTLNEGDALTTVTWDDSTPYGSGSGPAFGNQAGLPLRDASPVSVLSVVQQALKDCTAEGEIGGGGPGSTDPVWGRWVYYWDPVTYTLTLKVWWRYGLPAVTLDGCHVSTKATWTRVIGDVVYQWAIIDGVVYPFVASWQTPPYVANLPYVDAGFGTDEPRDNLVALVLQDDWTQLEGWRTRRIRYEASADYTTPPPVAGWASTGLARYQGLVPVIITPLGDALLVNGVDYLAGTLSGARVTIPPGGDYYLEIDLRSELPPNAELPE